MLEIQIENHKNYIVKKHNELIKAQGQLSSTAYKMLCSIISMIKADDSEFQEYALKIDDYLKLIDSKSNNKNFLKEQAKQLMQNPFEIEGKIFNWCSFVDLKKLEGYLIFEIHPKLKPYLLELRDKGNITQYQIVNILALKGDYSPRLYELIIKEWNIHKTYNKNSKSFTFELEINFLRDILKIPKTYAYADIKRRIFEVSKKQFKEKTNIQFDYKEQKLGRKVIRLQITVKENCKGSNDILKDEKVFINHIRTYYKKELLIKITDYKNGNFEGKIALACSENGRLYDMYQQTNLTAKESKTLWTFLFNNQEKINILKNKRLDI